MFYFHTIYTDGNILGTKIHFLKIFITTLHLVLQYAFDLYIPRRDDHNPSNNSYKYNLLIVLTNLKLLILIRFL